jgi:hypothetical protein
MAKLTTKARKALPSSDFAGPGRSYPDENLAHARDGLARAAGKPIAAKIRAVVTRKYPALGKPAA